jgi:hypothetical protein
MVNILLLFLALISSVIALNLFDRKRRNRMAEEERNEEDERIRSDHGL